MIQEIGDRERNISYYTGKLVTMKGISVIQEIGDHERNISYYTKNW